MPMPIANSDRIAKATSMIIGELDAWLADGIRLEKADGSARHRLDEKGFFLLVSGDGLKINRSHQIFVVQHDWASAFKGAEDFDGGDFQLPFDQVCFEFRISGKRVCCLVREDDGQKSVWPIVELSRGWVAPITMFFLKDGQWSPKLAEADAPFDKRYGMLAPFMAEHIRAICVSLEAEVASADLVETPPKLNAARVKRGKQPLPDYRVVYLNHRPRSVGVAGGVSQKRLHFRRGHWRHLGEDRRTWVRWCLVGNPDLGFIDKQYRL